ncbi:PrpR N-terminal domain-containing protein [Bacillus infantis]|uniref:sigma-54-dependent transcriptional regulator n=1 Tax=Bacillus infantis TaxID=324767 RepID=UPI001CD3EDE2|nr:sigma-54-dependent transcriptional regulator [Bacillus infantis]MCA1041183.1 PrpR N-terminal domain-containing protein [Bacillus infantis]
MSNRCDLQHGMLCMKDIKERVMDMSMKILFIAPYQAMSNLIEQCRVEAGVDVDVKVANLEEAVPIASQAERDGYHVIISRGGTAKRIEKYTNLPVIDVHISGYDMLRVLTLANDFPGKKAIVGFSNITLGAKTITDILEIPTEVYTVEQAEEVDMLVPQLKEQGFRVIMGDVVTVNVADRHGLEGILIQSGREAIFDAFQRAGSVTALFQKKQAEIEILKAALGKIGTDLIIVDEDKKIVFEQWGAIDPSSLPFEPHSLTAQQVDGAFSSTIMEDEAGGKVKMQSSPLVTQGKRYDLRSFSKLQNERTDSSGWLESVSQPPLIIHESKPMRDSLQDVADHIQKNKWNLIGEKGTGKRDLARYIHHQKHQGQGLLQMIDAAEAALGNVQLDEDMTTVYITGTKNMEHIQVKNLIDLAEVWIRTGKTVIIAHEEEDSLFHSWLFDENAARIYLPALRERKADIRAITAYFIAESHQEKGTSPIKIKEDAFQLLETYSWPGNISELKSVVFDAAGNENGYVLQKETIDALLDKKQKEGTALPESFLEGTLEQIEKRIIQECMVQENFNQTKVAKRLGINRSTLWRRLKD